jgi:pimeloyl-ACP methyl ester carboxylesterase
MGDAERLTIGTAGRELDVLVEGPEDGIALVFHSGTPSAAVRDPSLSRAAVGRGLRLITWSRPGYATSTPQPGRTVADAVADTAAVHDELGARQFVTIGHSGGGPHALACAALMPHRCLAAATLAGIAPYPAEGLDWLEGMADENHEEFGATLEGEAALRPILERWRAGLANLTGAEVAASLGGLVSDVDKAALTGEFAEVAAESFRRSVSTGIEGWLEDDFAFVKDWGFDLGSIKTPVAVWQGGEDRMVPYPHGKWLQAHIGGAQSRLFDTEGHLSLIHHIDRIVDDLLHLAGVQQLSRS